MEGKHNMKDRLVSLINNLKSKGLHLFDEAATKNAVILPLLQILGWNPFDVDEVKPEYPVAGGRVDYSLRLVDVNKVFIEVKRIAEDLAQHQQQLLDYSFKEGIKLAILTNGITWWFYLPLNEGSWEQRRFYTIDLLEQSPEDIAEKFIDFLSRESISSGKAVESAEHIYRGQQRRNTLETTLPKAWDKVVSEPDELLVELLSETTEKLCGFRADPEVVERFLAKYTERLLLTHIASLPSPRSVSLGPTKVSRSGQCGCVAVSQGTYQGKKIIGFCFRNEHHAVSAWKDLLIKVSETIYRLRPNDFHSIAPTVRGVRRTARGYFSRDPKEFRDPVEIADTRIYVEVHLNANETVKRTCNILSAFRYSKSDLRIETR
jgi:hypothetical protein